MRIIVTGAAGFIGFHLCKRLSKSKNDVVGIDNFNEYYDVNLKNSRSKILEDCGVNIKQIDLIDKVSIDSFLQKYKPDLVIHLAAQAGVRYSIEEPSKYIDSNITGYINLLEGAKNNNCGRIIYASSSSVYGDADRVPFSEKNPTDSPVSIYAATKKTNELLANVYHEIYGLSLIGLRFFTVYGPWGRPDMAYFSFTKKILSGDKIQVYNYGKMRRDFTYIQDIISAIENIVDSFPENKCNEIYNLGNNEPKELNFFIKVLEDLLGKKANIEYVDHQLGDVKTTYADISKINNFVKFSPDTKLEEGLKKFIDWYKSYY